MSIVTIQCRLLASERVRQSLWALTAEVYTPFVNKLLTTLVTHEDTKQWQAAGRIPRTALKSVVAQVKQQPQFSHLGSYWVASAQAEVGQIYESWLIGRRQARQRLAGKKLYLSMLKSDDDLAEECGLTIQELQAQAQAMLDHPPKDWFESYQEVQAKQDILSSSVIAYIIKHGKRIPTRAEDSKRLELKRRRIEIQVERLSVQLDSRFPQGRDLTGINQNAALDVVNQEWFEDEADFRQWQAQITAEPDSLPFPVSYATNGNIHWSKNNKGRITVEFAGIRGLTFEVRCDQRQLPWFERFLHDQTIFKSSKGSHSEGLFTLRSVQLLWKPGIGKGTPWEANYLYLHCAVDTALWSDEGTQVVRSRKLETAKRTIQNLHDKEELSKSQAGFLKRQQSLQAKLDGNFPRPSHPIYEGKPELVVGVIFNDHHQPAVALINLTQPGVITCRSLKQLLGDDYGLVNRLRYTKKQERHIHKIQQQKGATAFPRSSNLATHVERLVAKAIVNFAQEYLACSVILPKVSNMREVIQAQVQARAEQSIPGCKEAQKRYLKEYRINAHRWSYNRLLSCIRNQALKRNLRVEEGWQGREQTLKEQALGLVMSAYHLRSPP